MRILKRYSAHIVGYVMGCLLAVPTFYFFLDSATDASRTIVIVSTVVFWVLITLVLLWLGTREVK